MNDPIILTEHNPATALLRDQDADLLRRHFEKQLPILQVGEQYLLQPRQYVGLIPLPSGRRIEIRPKVPIGAVLAMLAKVHRLSDFEGEAQRYDSPYHSTADLFTLIGTMFLRQVNDLIRQGLLRGYRTAVEESSAIRGKLQITETLRRPPVVLHQSEFNDLSIDIAENRLLKLACERLAMIESSDRTQLRRVFQVLSEVATVALDSITIHDHRGNTHYQPALALARLLLAYLSPGGAYDAQAGPTVPAFLVDMNRLFEGYVTAILENTLIVRRQQTYPLDQDSQVIVRPDVVICTDDGQPVLALDAKYKRENANTDIYQAVAYCHALGINRAILVYPASDDRTLKRYNIRSIRAADKSVEVLLLPLDLSGDPMQMARQAQTLTVMVIESIKL